MRGLRLVRDAAVVDEVDVDADSCVCVGGATGVRELDQCRVGCAVAHGEGNARAAVIVAIAVDVDADGEVEVGVRGICRGAAFAGARQEEERERRP
jgi:hypothetical protein